MKPEIIELEVLVDDVNETQYLAMHEGQCVGRVGVKAEGLLVASVRQLFVKEEFRKQGLGTELMQRCIDFAKEGQCWSINLAVAKENRGVWPFYRKLGFHVCVAYEEEWTLALPLIDSCPNCEELVNLREKVKELEQTFSLQYQCDQRAIKMWQKAHPGNDLTWPDGAKLSVWLMEQREQMCGAIQEAHAAIEQMTVFLPRRGDILDAASLNEGRSSPYDVATERLRRALVRLQEEMPVEEAAE